MSRRRLTAEERALWQQVARSTDRRLHPERHEASAPLQRSQSGPENRPASQVEPFRLGEKAKNDTAGHDILPGLPDRLAAAPVTMDKKAFGRLKRGKLEPQARLDLHGMTRERAHPALTGFILRAQAEGKRLVLVITGKGKDRDDGGPIPERAGILRHSVPQWLAQPPLAQAVLQVSPAHARHGGGGAYYVYLRRRR
jgi:DNA-nicking Smr family endonuclease